MIVPAPAVCEAGIPFVEGNCKSADGKRSRNGDSMSRVFTLVPVGLVERSAHNKRAFRHHYHLGASVAFFETIFWFQSCLPFRRKGIDADREYLGWGVGSRRRRV